MHGARPLLRSSSLLPRLALNGNSQRRSDSRQQRGTRTGAQALGAAGVAEAAAAAAAAGGGSLWSRVLAAAALTALGSGATLAATQLQQQQQRQQQEEQRSAGAGGTRGSGRSPLASGWAKGIGEEEGSVKVLTAEALMAQDHPFLEDDHMFSAFVSRGIIQDLEGWYHPASRRFSAVVALGREVAGFPRVVHGGLTAAIFDEAFGGLLFSLKRSGAAGFWGPAYTVQLDVSYKAKIPAGAVVLCAAAVESQEGRKLWMTATMSDGPDGKVYATARALFVAPKPQRLLTDVVKYLWQRAGEVLPGGGAVDTRPDA